MAKIKWDPAATPLNNEHDGYTFQRNNYGYSMFPAARSARKRYPRQWLRQHPNQKAVTQWRNMPQSIKDQWALFAATFPQPAQKDPDQFLNGFECFVKRNYFCFLNHGIHSDFMLEPNLIVNEGEPITFAIKAETTAIECAELYIKNFGLLPQVGDKLLVYAAVYSEFTGHFYESINTYAIVEEIYIDSFQIAVYIPDTFNDVTVSVYLSKPVSPGISYVGTKIRYMGCFTTKTFLGLQDTPDSYSGKGNQIVRVNITENGLEFAEIDSGGNAFNPITVNGQDNITADSVAQALELVAGEGITIETDNTNKQIIISAAGGGGLSCEDLLDCEIIQTISDAVAETGITSVPAVNFGICYSTYCLYNSMAIVPDGWHIPTRTEWESFISYMLTLGTPMNLILEPNLSYWNIVPGTWTNQQKFNGRGTGYMDGLHAYALNFKGMAAFWSSTAAYSIRYYSVRFSESQPDGQFTSNGYTYWVPIRFAKDSTSLQNGQSGVFVSWSGKRYRTICIDNIEYMADNLNETTLPDGSAIEVITNPSEARYLNYPTICYPDLNENYR